jgi:hypothetical protein
MTQHSEVERWPRRPDRIALGRQTGGLLRTLGADAGSVATSLAVAGVKGQPADARQCALAVYLHAVMDGDPRVASVRVFHDRLVIGSPGRVRQHRVVVALPQAVRAFVAGFDAQRYPMLVRAERPAPKAPAADTAASAAS